MKRIGFAFLQWGTVNPRQVAKKLLPPILVDVAKWFLRNNKDTNEEAIQQYLHGGRVPWSRGYRVYKRRLIMQALADESLLDCFRLGAALPPGYGFGVDERCIEYPWLMAHLHDEPEVLLDAGSTLNYDFILNHPALRRKVIHVLTLAPEGNFFWQKGISYLFHDLRDIPIRDDYYDTIACLSTLEHVGLDNTMYTRSEKYREQRVRDFVHGMHELGRVLAPGGQLLLTVPFGEYRNFGSFQQFNSRLLNEAVDAFDGQQIQRSFFRYLPEGWQRATEAECQTCRYVEWITRPRNQWPKPFPAELDRAAAARALACLILRKSIN